MIEKLPVKDSLKKDDFVEIITASSVITNVDSFFILDNMNTSINISGEIFAPIEEGQKLGEATYTIYGEKYTVDLVAKNSVERKPDFDLLGLISNILIIFLRVIIGFVVLVLIVRIINKIRKKKKRRAKVKRTRRYNARFHK